MYDDAFVGILYWVAKLLAYSFWCGVGVRLFRPEWNTWLIGRGLGFGFIRFLMGLVFGFVVGLIAISSVTDQTTALGFYFKYYVTVRIIEWGLTYLMIAGSRFDRRTIAWIVGGIIVSFLVDAIIFAPGGWQIVPGGRILC